MMSPATQRSARSVAEGFSVPPSPKSASQTAADAAVAARPLSARAAAAHKVSPAATASGQVPRSALEFLTDDRFAELDWDADNKVRAIRRCQLSAHTLRTTHPHPRSHTPPQITFREFLYAFVNWVGIESSEDDDDEALAAAAPVTGFFGSKRISRNSRGSRHSTSSRAKE